MTKLGAHIKQGSRNNYDQLCEAKPAVVLAANEGGALVEAATKSGGHTWTIFRDTTIYKDAPHGIDQATPAQARQMADSIYPQLKAIWNLNPADFYTVLNEPAGHHLEVMPNYIAYELRMMELAEADGRKLCLLNLAWGTPDDGNVAGGDPNGGIETWKQVYVPHIIRGFSAGHIYGRHDYGVMESGAAGRGFQEAAYLRSIGQHGGIVFTELGYNAGDKFIGTAEFMTRSAQFDILMRQHSNIIGCCIWTLGEWQGTNEANWEPAMLPLASYLIDNPTPKWEPEEPPMDTWQEQAAKIADDTQALFYKKGASLQTVPTSQGFQVFGNEFDFVRPDGVKIRMRGAIHPMTAVRRYYWVVIPNWSDVQWYEVDGGTPTPPPFPVTIPQ